MVDIDYSKSIMKKLLAFVLNILSLQVSAETKVDVELDVFGLSYHFNRDYDFNEVNPGVGLSVVINDGPSNPHAPKSFWHLSMVASGGFYKDSFNDQATFLVVGPRITLGDDDSFHTRLSLQAGYLNGSGAKGIGAIPMLSVGYDWFDVCITGNPLGSNKTEQTSATTAVAHSRMVAVFLKFRVLDF